jgi:hypothetical protein
MLLKCTVCCKYRYVFKKFKKFCKNRFTTLTILCNKFRKSEKRSPIQEASKGMDPWSATLLRSLNLPWLSILKIRNKEDRSEKLSRDHSKIPCNHGCGSGLIYYRSGSSIFAQSGSGSKLKQNFRRQFVSLNQKYLCNSSKKFSKSTLCYFILFQWQN